MVVHYLYIFSARFRPTKTDAPLIIDADTMLTGSIATESLKAIAGWHAQIVQAAGDLELPELAPCYAGDVDQALDAAAPGESLGFGRLERFNQWL